MIVKENIEINGTWYVRTYSDSGFYIRLGENEYSCAIDLAESQWEYSETQNPIEPFTCSVFALNVLAGQNETPAIKTARNMRKLMEQGAESLDDQTVSTAPEVLPRLRGDGSLIKSGARICWKGTVKRAASDLWDNPENTPDAAPALWEDIQYKQGYRIIPEVITAGLAFSMGGAGMVGRQPVQVAAKL